MWVGIPKKDDIIMFFLFPSLSSYLSSLSISTTVMSDRLQPSECPCHSVPDFIYIYTRNHGTLLAGGIVDFARHLVFSTVVVNGISGRVRTPLLPPKQ